MESSRKAKPKIEYLVERRNKNAKPTWPPMTEMANELSLATFSRVDDFISTRGRKEK